VLVPDKIKILYVDDEMNNLIGFKASFRLDYKVLIANNINEAMKQLKDNPDIHIIFCDQRMPEKTGVQFFEDIRAEYPLPIRILLTGYADIESVIDAINRSQIFRYVKKPWDEIDIRSAVEEGNRFYVTNSMLLLKNKELELAYNELDKFAYSVTHDIRRPLLSILGAIDVSAFIDDIGELREMLQLMEESVKNLDVYIQSIHDYYKLRRGELVIEEIDFKTIVSEQQDLFKLTSRINNVEFKCSVHQEESFRSDNISLKLILNNLLSNAEGC
jgi:response regulator RpfG family c-di-GMP phosphodiesterase